MESFLRIAPPLASMACFIAPYRTVSNIARTQTTGDLPALTFVSMSVMCAIWGTYGGLKGDMTVLIPNVIGSALSLYYLHIFETYTPKGMRANELSRWYQAGIGLLALILLKVSFGEVASAANVVGTCGAILSVIFSASPLLALPAVMKSKSAEAIPLPTSLMLFTSSTLWSAYGFHIDDRSILVPNVVGFVASASQLLVHIVFHFGFIAKNTEGVKVASL
jgi:uncharacterized protein with PQ loop repeat